MTGDHPPNSAKPQACRPAGAPGVRFRPHRNGVARQSGYHRWSSAPERTGSASSAERPARRTTPTARSATSAWCSASLGLSTTGRHRRRRVVIIPLRLVEIRTSPSPNNNRARYAGQSRHSGLRSRLSVPTTVVEFDAEQIGQVPLALGGGRLGRFARRFGRPRGPRRSPAQRHYQPPGLSSSSASPAACWRRVLINCARCDRSVRRVVKSCSRAGPLPAPAFRRTSGDGRKK